MKKGLKMILLVTALQIEARPLVEFYRLKKDMTEHCWQVYHGHDILLIVSGTGKIKAGMAAAHLLSRQDPARVAALVNFGICGSNSGRHNPGAVLIAHKIRDMDSGRDYYPDLFIGGSLPGMSLQCHAKPVYNPSSEGGPALFCDMESAGIMEAAGKYLLTHQVAIIKVISDRLDRQRLAEQTVKKQLAEAVPVLDNVVRELLALPRPANLPVAEQDLVRTIAGRLNLTESMNRQLRDQVTRAFLTGKNPAAITSLLPAERVKTRQERQDCFERIIRTLEA